jgi:hypothetical protein
MQVITPIISYKIFSASYSKYGVNKNLRIGISHNIIDLMSPPTGLTQKLQHFCYQKAVPMGQ